MVAHGDWEAGGGVQGLGCVRIGVLGLCEGWGVQGLGTGTDVPGLDCAQGWGCAGGVPPRCPLPATACPSLSLSLSPCPSHPLMPYSPPPHPLCGAHHPPLPISTPPSSSPAPPTWGAGGGIFLGSPPSPPPLQSTPPSASTCSLSAPPPSSSTRTWSKSSWDPQVSDGNGERGGWHHRHPWVLPPTSSPPPPLPRCPGAAVGAVSPAGSPPAPQLHVQPARRVPHRRHRPQPDPRLPHLPRGRAGRQRYGDNTGGTFWGYAEDTP